MAVQLAQPARLGGQGHARFPSLPRATPLLAETLRGRESLSTTLWVRNFNPLRKFGVCLVNLGSKT